MGIQEIKQEARLREWQERIWECRNSGQPVRRWCSEHNISVQTYYRWEKRCITQAAGMADSSTAAVRLIKIAPESLPTARTPYPGTPTTPQSVTIRMGKVSIELLSGTDAEQIAQLVRALNHA